MNAGLDVNGVLVQQNVCPKEAVEICYAEVLEHLSMLLALPQTMAEMNRATGRHFLAFSVAKSFERPLREPEHRRDVLLPLSAPVKTVLEILLSGSTGDVVASAVGESAELCGLSAIVSDPGAIRQSIHSDAEWRVNSPRLVTIFLALHDILTEDLGPTKFVPKTHTPHCFTEGKWLPPTETLVAGRGGSTWFKLHAGDCVLMDSTGNSSADRRRALLSISFTALNDAGNYGNSKLWRLGDFRK